MQYVLFTDNIKELGIREACRAARKAGFDGLDLTFRPGGHVLPENAADGLAAAQQIADEESCVIPMVETGITSVTTPHAEEIIAAAHMRTSVLKLGYWRYEPFGTLVKQLDEARRRLEGIVNLARRYHLRPSIHVHSGPVLTNTPLIYLLLKDFSPEEVGVYLDPMHMVLEGGRSGWELTLDLIAPWVNAVGIKSFVFQPTGRDADGQQNYVWKCVPPADGVVPMAAFFRRLKHIGFDGVVSFHSEYKSVNSARVLSTPDLLVQSAADLAFIKRIVAKL